MHKQTRLDAAAREAARKAAGLTSQGGCCRCMPATSREGLNLPSRKTSVNLKHQSIFKQHQSIFRNKNAVCYEVGVQ